MLTKMIALTCALMMLGACANYAPPDGDPQQLKADSCRTDPYQDMCQPGYVES